MGETEPQPASSGHLGRAALHVLSSLRPVDPDSGDPPDDPDPVDAAALWCAAAAAAEEPCLAIDADGVVLAVSESAAQLLAGTRPERLVGHPLLDCAVELLSFSGAPERLSPSEGDRLPPLIAARTRQLARGLLRVRVTTPGGRVGQVNQVVRTIDAVSAPLVDADRVVGSITFLALV